MSYWAVNDLVYSTSEIGRSLSINRENVGRIYHKAMLIELGKANLKTESEKALRVYYENSVIGEYSADIFVEDEIIVELKSVERVVKAHEVQIVNYLTASKKDIGLLINFGPTGVSVKRKFRKPLKKNPENPVNPVQK